MQIEVIKEIDSETKETYRFNIFDFNIVFVEYYKLEKQKGKRLWKVQESWNRYNNRDNKIIEPELSLEIRELALIKTKELIKVQTWDEWKGVTKS